MNYPIFFRIILSVLILYNFINTCFAQLDYFGRTIYYLPSVSVDNNLIEFNNLPVVDNITNYNIGLNIRHIKRKSIYIFSVNTLINSYSLQLKNHLYNCSDCLFRQKPFAYNYIGKISALYKISRSKFYIETALQGSILNKYYNPQIHIWGTLPNKIQDRSISIFVGFRKIYIVKPFEFHLKILPFYKKEFSEYYFTNSRHLRSMQAVGLILELEIMLNLYKPPGKQPKWKYE